MSKYTDLDSLYEYLLTFVNVEKGQKTDFKLDRMRHLCVELGNPEKSFKSVHIAGSKGKGSVSIMIASILSAEGLKTGLFMSPHVVSFKERITLSGRDFEDKVFLHAMDSIVPLVDGKKASDFPGDALPTFFELMTLLGFVIFRETGCAWGVIETGLGGRLDSTNVIIPEASIITSIELEHTEYLGTTIPEIAREKGGIIKPGVPVFIGRLSDDAKKEIVSIAKERHSPLYDITEEADVSNISLGEDGTGFRSEFRDTSLFGTPIAAKSAMIGSIQAHNAVLSLYTAKKIIPSLAHDSITKGLAKAKLPARFEIVQHEGCDIVLDGAHTPESVKLLLKSYLSIFGSGTCMVFACAVDKKHREIAEILAPSFGTIVVTKPGTFKASTPSAVYESFKLFNGSASLEENTQEAFAAAFEAAKASKKTLLVTGSFYLCAEVKKIILGK